jgi:maltooligosyltrehalose trehalohydrolase
MEVTGYERAKVLMLRRWSPVDEALVIYNLNAVTASVTIPVIPGGWQKRLDSADDRWNGPGGALWNRVVEAGTMAFPLPPHSFILLATRREI